MKRTVALFTFLALVNCAHFGPAQVKAVQQQPSQLEQDWKEMQRKDPAAWGKFKASMVLDAQQALAEFGYGTVFTSVLDDRTQEALRNYQRRSNLPVTGDVDAATWTQLKKDESALEPQIMMGPLYTFSDSEWNNYVRVQGVWLEQGKEPDASTPWITAVVECMKSANICVAAQFDGSGYIHLEWFDVERWDKFEITTKPNDLPCGRETIRITKPDRTLLSINMAAYKNMEACTKLFGKPGKELISRLADVTKINDARLKVFQAAEDRIKVTSPNAKRRVGVETH